MASEHVKQQLHHMVVKAYCNLVFRVHKLLLLSILTMAIATQTFDKEGHNTAWHTKHTRTKTPNLKMVSERLNRQQLQTVL